MADSPSVNLGLTPSMADPSLALSSSARPILMNNDPGQFQPVRGPATPLKGANQYPNHGFVQQSLGSFGSFPHPNPLFNL